MKKKSDSVVEFTLEKTRRTGGEGTSVNLRRAWHEGCFVSDSPYQRKLELVRGGAGDDDPFSPGDDVAGDIGELF